MQIEFSVASGAPETIETECLVAGVFKSKGLSETAKRLDKASGGRITRVLDDGDHDGNRGRTVTLYDLEGVSAKRVVLVGLGNEKDLSPTSLRSATRYATQAVERLQVADAVFSLTSLDVPDYAAAARGRSVAETVIDTRYKFDKKLAKSASRRRSRSGAKTSVQRADRHSKLKRVSLYGSNKREATAVEKGQTIGVAVAEGRCLARDLGNLPANLCTPTHLAEVAQEMGRDSALKVTVFDEKRIEKLRMRTFLSVAKGSREAPRFIQFEYHGGRKNAAPVVLIGKGITFDSGGISIKPASGMDEMKFDMCGAASVFGVMHAIQMLKPKINVIGLVPACENLPDGAANKPGDVIESMSGQTIEILNTDAEGRLILCDALTYSEKFKPRAVIDIATLTGACVIALGEHASGLFSNDQALADALLEAGNTGNDRAWQMPVWSEYQSQLDSNFADMANVGGRPAGAITAACFLARFAKELKWAHLDIAGTAWHTGGSRKGATGRPVGLLTSYLTQVAGR